MHRVQTALLAMGALLALSAFAAACGDDDNKGDTGSENTATTRSATGAATGTGSRGTPSTADATSTASGTAGSPGASPSAANGSPAASPSPGDAGTLKDAVKDVSSLTFHVVYDVTSKASDGKESSLRYTSSNKPPKSAVRIEDVAAAETYVSVRDGEFSFFCIESEKACFKSKLTKDDLAEGVLPTFDPETIVDDAESEGATAKEVAGRTIAGRDARCWDITDPTGSGTLCLDKATGVTLLVEGNFSGEDSKFEAKEFSGSVSDDVFVIPSEWEITDLDAGSDATP